MPRPRQKDDGSSGAPVLDILSAHVRLEDVVEHEEPFTVTRERDGATFKLDPGFDCKVVVVRGHDAEGEDAAGATFFERFRYSNTKKDKSGDWILKENSKLGKLAKVVHPEYLEDDSVPALSEEDLEGLEFLCTVRPKKHPETGKVLGSTVDWESLRRLPPTAKVASTQEDAQIDEGDFDDIPF